MKHASSGMLHLSIKGIIHRDLALRNLLISKQSEKYIVKVSDFGTSF